MVARPTPTIKGVFVNSHINMVRKLKGAEGVRQMEKRYGKPLRFKYLEEVPVREEVKIIELAFDLVNEKEITPADRAFEAGRLHFRNFSGTALGKIILHSLPASFKKIMMKVPYVAIHVFRNVKFTVVDRGERSVEVIMENNDYPIEHFRGLFYEWMHFMKHKGTVLAELLPGGTFSYTLSWK